MTDGEPGYCACCRGFHLLYRRTVRNLDQPADICRECIALGDGEVAWRMAGVTEDGFGYEADLPPAPRGNRGMRSGRLVESLILSDAGGFGEARRGIRWRAFIAWQRVRGRL